MPPNFANLKVGDVSGEAEVYADLSHRVQPVNARMLDLNLNYAWLVIRSRDAEGLGPVFWLITKGADGCTISPSDRAGRRSRGQFLTCALPWTALDYVGSAHGVEDYPADPVFEDNTPPAGLSRAEKFKAIVADAFSANRHTVVEFVLGSGPRDALVAKAHGNGRIVLSLLLTPEGAVVIKSPDYQATAPTAEELTEASGSLALSAAQLAQAGLAKR